MRDGAGAHVVAVARLSGALCAEIAAQIAAGTQVGQKPPPPSLPY